MKERTCPECNCAVMDGACTNPDGCRYGGIGWDATQRAAAWNEIGDDERTSGHCDYPGIN